MHGADAEEEDPGYLRRRETIAKFSAELGDWLLRCNAGEGMSQCAPWCRSTQYLTRTNAHNPRSL